MITVIGGTKGGTGKSTVATNLAVILANAGRDVLLVDADEQETSTDFTNLRNQNRPGGAGYTCVPLTGRAVLTELKRLAPKYQEVVVDTGGANTASQRGALAICDLLLVPLAPRSFDIWTIEKVVGLIEEARALNPDFRACTMLNRADASGDFNAQAAELIKGQSSLELLPLAIGARKAYGQAASSGLSVTELRPQNPKASEEMRSLVRELGYEFPAQA